MADDSATTSGNSSTASAPASSSSKGGSDLTRLVLLGLAVGAGMMLAKQLPDLRRYLKLRSM